MNGLSVKGLSKRIAGHGEVLRDISLDISAGERFVLLGPSGSGKTTLLRIIAGLDTADSGEVRFGETSWQNVPAERRGLGVVFQEPLLFPHLTVGQNVAFALRLRSMPPVQIQAAVTEALERVELSGFGNRRPRQLSGGQAQRVALARALVTRPHALLLDEPFSALDLPLRRELRAWLVRLQAETQTTMVFVTHDQEEALSVGQRMGLLLDGRLTQAGTPQEFYARPVSEAVARFFGGTNLIHGEQRGHEVRTGLGVFQVPVERHGKVVLSIRPEAPVRAQEGDRNCFGALVRQVEFAGAYQRVALTSPGHESGEDTILEWHAPLFPALSSGMRLVLTCPPPACWTIPAPQHGEPPHEHAP